MKEQCGSCVYFKTLFRDFEKAKDSDCCTLFANEDNGFVTETEEHGMCEMFTPKSIEFTAEQAEKLCDLIESKEGQTMTDVEAIEYLENMCSENAPLVKACRMGASALREKQEREAGTYQPCLNADRSEIEAAIAEIELDIKPMNPYSEKALNLAIATLWDAAGRENPEPTDIGRTQKDGWGRR